MLLRSAFCVLRSWNNNGKYVTKNLTFISTDRTFHSVSSPESIGKASELWTRTNHGDKTHWRDMPNYAILVDIRDRPSSQITYVPEENIEVITNTKIVHQILEEYFVEFDGSRYLPRPWLKKVYPHG